MNLGTQHLDDGTAVIAPEGRLTMTSTAALRTLITETVDGGRTHVVVDLAATSFIDSSGLGALVSCLKRLGPRGSLAVAGATGAVSRLFTLTRMDRVFALHPNVDAAVEQLSA